MSFKRTMDKAIKILNQADGKQLDAANFYVILEENRKRIKYASKNFSAVSAALEAKKAYPGATLLWVENSSGKNIGRPEV